MGNTSSTTQKNEPAPTMMDGDGPSDFTDEPEQESTEEGSEFYDVNLDDGSGKFNSDFVNDNFRKLLALVKANNKSDLIILLDSQFKHALNMTQDQISGIVNKYDEAGKTPIQYSLEQGHHDITRLLLENGAKLKYVTDYLQPILFNAIITKSMSDPVLKWIETYIPANLHTAFYNTIYTSPYQIEGGAKIGGRISLLHLAAGVGNYAATKYLLSKGANINLTNNEGNTPLHYAVFPYDQKCKFITLNTLLENGANIDAKNGSGMTPLHLFALKTTADSDNLMCFHVLISHLTTITSLNIKDRVGKTPRDYCWSDTQVCSLLNELAVIKPAYSKEDNVAFDKKRKCSIRIRNAKIKTNIRELKDQVTKLELERDVAGPLEQHKITERIEKLKKEIMYVEYKSLPLGQYEPQCQTAEEGVKDVGVFDPNEDIRKSMARLVEANANMIKAAANLPKDIKPSESEELRAHRDSVSAREEELQDAIAKDTIDRSAVTPISDAPTATIPVEPSTPLPVEPSTPLPVESLQPSAVSVPLNTELTSGNESMDSELAPTSSATSVPNQTGILSGIKEAINTEYENKLNAAQLKLTNFEVELAILNRRIAEKNALEVQASEEKARLQAKAVEEAKALEEEKKQERRNLMVSISNAAMARNERIAKTLAEEEAKAKAEEEAKAKAEEEEARVKAEEEEARVKAEEDAKAKASVQANIEAKVNLLLKEEAKLKASAQALTQVKVELPKQTEEEVKTEEEVNVNLLLEEEAKLKASAQALTQAKLEDKKQSEEETKTQEEQTENIRPEDIRAKINIVIATANLLIHMTDRYKEQIKATKNALLAKPELGEKYAEFNKHSRDAQNDALLLLEAKHEALDGSPFGLVVIYKDLFLTAKEINAFFKSGLRKNKILLYSYVFKMALLLSSENVFIFEHMIQYSPEFNLDYSQSNARNVIQNRVKTNPNFLAGDDKDTDKNTEIISNLNATFQKKLKKITERVPNPE